MAYSRISLSCCILACSALVVVGKSILPSSGVAWFISHGTFWMVLKVVIAVVRREGVVRAYSPPKLIVEAAKASGARDGHSAQPSAALPNWDASILFNLDTAVVPKLDHCVVLYVRNDKDLADMNQAPLANCIFGHARIVHAVNRAVMRDAGREDANLAAFIDPILHAPDHKRHGSAYMSRAFPSIVIGESPVEVNTDPAVHS